MRKFAVLFLLSVLVLTLGSCSDTNPVILSLPEYDSSIYYTSGGIQDYTNYGKYTYTYVAPEDLERSGYFKKATEEDVEEILEYIANFEGWVETIGGKLQNNYDFDTEIISENDFFYINTKYGDPIGESTYGKFDNYSVYYFHIETQTLYYFHSNI